jgi:acyl-CoA reductase-like NAD-dependent aldehyde dehydrogenase
MNKLQLLNRFPSCSLLMDEKASNDSLMPVELFGPILPIITIDSEEEALRFIRDR